MSPMLQADDMIRIHNHESTDLKLRWGSKPYLIKAGRDGFVPFGLAKMKFGDPRSKAEKIRVQVDLNTVEFIPSRHDELARLTIQYGCYESENDPAAIKSKMPNVTLYTIEGDELMLVVDDPYNEIADGFDEFRADRDSAMEEVSALRRRVIMLESYLGSMMPDDQREEPTVDVPTSSPTQPRSHVEVPHPMFGTEEGDGWEVDDSDQPSRGIVEDSPVRGPTLRPKSRLVPAGI